MVARWRISTVLVIATSCAGASSSDAESGASTSATSTSAGDDATITSAAGTTGSTAATATASTLEPTSEPTSVDSTTADTGEGGAWVEVCSGETVDCAGATTMRARGFQWRLPWDPERECHLYYGATDANLTIYSDTLWCYADGVATQVLSAGVTDGGCAQAGPPGDGFNPLLGHPQGYMWFQDGAFFATAQLCQGYLMGYTTRWVSASEELALLPIAPTHSGAGTFDALVPNFETCEHVADVGLTICGPYSGSADTPMMWEFDGTEYTDVTAMVGGTAPALPLTATGWVSDGARIWQYGGCRGTSPGNGGDNDCPDKVNELFRYEPIARAWEAVAPNGGVLPPANNSSFPLLAYDPFRDRLLLYADTDALWEFDIATETWSTLVSENGPVFEASLIAGNGNMAGFDPARDRLVVIYPKTGQSNAPAIHELQF